MASKALRLFGSEFSGLGGTQVRHGHWMRGKPPAIARSLKQRLEESKQQQEDPSISFRVDIGCPVPSFTRKTLPKTWLDEWKARRSDPDLERKSRNRELSIDLENAREIWVKTVAPVHIRRIAEHYGIFKDLYGDAYFMPIVETRIEYSVEGDVAARVCTGNVVKPREAAVAPTVEYAADPDTLWTLIMTTPDGNMQNANNEYCHWFMGNIPGNALEHGEQILDYLRPIPPRGVGYYRYVFVLYKQTECLDFTEYKKAQPCLQLKERDWNTLEFYRKHQDHLTPAGIAFFQSDWDQSVSEFFHTTLGTKEPVFQYDFPKPYIKPQKWFPLREPFNTYMDKYRDPKEITKEFLLKKLKNVHPFGKAPPALKYPNAHSFGKNVPSWLTLERKKERLGLGRVNDIRS